MLRLLQRATTRALVFLSVLLPVGAMAQFGVPAPVTPAPPCPAFTGFPLTLNLGTASLFGNDGITNRCAFQTTQSALNALSTQAGASATAIANNTTAIANNVAAIATNATAIASETSRATTAEALLAPRSSPIFTGLTQIGSTVYPASAVPVTTTATGSNGATTITVASATGIKVGATAYGAGISGGCQTKGAAFQGTFVAAISGTTVTLSCPLVGALSNTNVQFGVQRNDPAATTLTNTVMAREGLFGAASQGASTAWLGQIVTGQDYPATGVIKAVSMPGTPGGIVAASRTSDATNGAGIYPMFCLYLADAWATTHDGSCAYYQSNLMTGTAGLYAHIQAESSVNTLWPATEVDPFKLNAVNSTTHHRFDCGTGQSGANAPNNCSTAFDFPANGAQIKTIATVYAGAMDTTGRIPQFMSLPPGVAAATWWSSAGVRSWDILSTATSGYGSLTLRNNSAGFFSDLTLDAGTNGGRSLNWTRAGNPNFSFGQSNDAAGNLSVSTFNDAGGFVSTPLQIRRGDGQVTINPLVVTGSLTVPFGAPASGTAPCSPGQISVDASFIYTCVATNSWRRTSVGSTF